MTGEITRVDNGPIALRSRLGWLVSGPVETDASRKLTHTNLPINYFDEPSSFDSQNNRLITTLKQFWEVEANGIEDTEHEVRI